MGRNPKAEPTENQKQTVAQPTAYSTPPPPPLAPASYTSPTPPAPPAIESPASVRAVTETETLAREIKDGTMSGFVGGGTTLSGEVVFKGMLRVDGHLTGRISSEKGTLIVSSGGRVDANVEVATAKINGIVNGDVIATERLEFGRTAQVQGNIQTPVLVIEQGAVFEGNCRMRRSDKAAEVKEQIEKPRAKESVMRNSLPPTVAGKNSAPNVAGTSNATA
jgi:cytoskeletal protein CcmA (bactofilin family)